MLFPLFWRFAAIARAASLIRLGEFDTIVAGGMESMSNAPYVLDKARFGYRMGDGQLKDSMMFDGLTCAIDQEAMGAATERYQGESHDYSRAAQDEWSARSHELPWRPHPGNHGYRCNDAWYRPYQAGFCLARVHSAT